MATISANPSCNGMVRSNNHCAILNLPDCILIQVYVPNPYFLPVTGFSNRFTENIYFRFSVT